MLRTCYSSDWKLFRGSDLVTQGRYYFSPPNTPFAPSPTLLWSRNCTEGEWDDIDDTFHLGEQFDNRQRYSNGSPPINLPFPRSFDHTDCLSDGETNGVWGPWEDSLYNAPTEFTDNIPTFTYPAAFGCFGPGPPGTDYTTTLQRSIYSPNPVRVTWRVYGTLPHAPTTIATVTGSTNHGSFMAEGNDFGPAMCAVYPWERSGYVDLPAGVSEFTFVFHIGGGGNLYTQGTLSIELSAPATIEDPVIRDDFDQRCYVVPYPPGYVELYPNIHSREMAAGLARVLALTYSDQAAADALLINLLGPTVTVQSVPNSSSVIPGSMLATGNNYQMVVISGTSSFEQFAAQALYSLFGPLSFGTYSTSPFWAGSATTVASRLTSQGLDPAKPVILVGHSYGGVLACLLAVFMKQYRPDRNIDLLTFGMPKPGGRDTIATVDSINNRHYANVGDPMPSLPPDFSILSSMFLLVGPIAFLFWPTWRSPRNQVLISRTGELIDSLAPTAAYTQLLDAVTQALLGNPLPVFTDHMAGEYARRLDL